MKKRMHDISKQYADAARAYFRHHRVVRYRLKKIADMNDREIIQACHWWQEENDMVADYWNFVKENFPELT